MDINFVRDSYVHLKEYLGLEIEEQFKPNSAMEVIPHPAVLAELGVDMTSVKLGSVKRKKQYPRSDGLTEDEWGVIRKRYF